MIKKGHGLLIVVVCPIISFLLGLQIYLELPPDWPPFKTNIPVRAMIPFFSMIIGLVVAAIIINLIGVELEGQEWEKARKKREKSLQEAGLGFILIGTLALFASSGASGYERTEIQVVGILTLIVGSLITINILYLLFSGVSIVLVYAGYPQIPAFIVIIPFLLAGLLGSGSKKGGDGGGGTRDTVEQKHYDKYGGYKGYNRQRGDKIEHYDEYDRYTGYSIRQGSRMIQYDKEGRYVGEYEEKRPPGRA